MEWSSITLVSFISSRTLRFTSSRDVAATTQATYFCSPRFDATMIVFADCSGGTP